jgi:hypothetical protein
VDRIADGSLKCAKKQLTDRKTEVYGLGDGA